MKTKTNIKPANLRRLFIAFLILAITAASALNSPARAIAAEQPKTAQSPSETQKQLLKTFDYNPALPLNATIEPIRKTPGYEEFRLSYDSVNNERIPASLFLPAKKTAPWPCVIVMHGYGGDKTMGALFAMAMAPRGYAIISIDAQYHGDRKKQGKDILSTDVQSNAAAMAQTIIDLRRAVDYLRTRKDIDASRVGYVGASMGSFLGAVFMGVDTRVKTAVLIVGGANWEEMIKTSKVPPFDALRDMYKTKNLPYSDYGQKMSAVDPLNFASLISPRELLMLNCSNDKYVPKPTAEQLFNAASEPKQIQWFACQGDIAHIPPMDKVNALVKSWFSRTLAN